MNNDTPTRMPMLGISVPPTEKMHALALEIENELAGALVARVCACSVYSSEVATA